MDVTGDEDMAQQVDDLNHSVTIDDDIATGVDEGEVVIIVGSTSAEHQLESWSVVVSAGGEGVGWCDQQVDVGASEIVD